MKRIWIFMILIASPIMVFGQGSGSAAVRQSTVSAGGTAGFHHGLWWWWRLWLRRWADRPGRRLAGYVAGHQCPGAIQPGHERGGGQLDPGREQSVAEQCSRRADLLADARYRPCRTREGTRPASHARTTRPHGSRRGPARSERRARSIPSAASCTGLPLCRIPISKPSGVRSTSTRPSG